MYPVVWWIIAAVVLLILELSTVSFFFLWISAGAFLTAILSYFVDTAWVQYATFVGTSVLLVTASRPWATRLSGATQRAANVDALVGQKVIVTKVEKHIPTKGYAKAGSEIWKAESENQEPLNVNAEVTVVSVQGNTLTVRI
jgi:inner membrane protein